MSRPPCRLLLAVATLTVVSCGTTRVVTTWQAPEARPIAFTNLLALVLAPEESTRRVAEDAICRQARAAPCTPSYRVIPDVERRNTEQVRARVQRAGFDGVVVFHIVRADETVTYVPPTFYPSFWGYYGYAYPLVASPGSVRTDTVVRVETSIYALRDDRLLWVGSTETLNPDSVDELVEDIAGAVRRELERGGLIPPGNSN